MFVCLSSSVINGGLRRLEWTCMSTPFARARSWNCCRSVYFTCANEGLTNAKHAASLQRLQSGRLLTCWNCLEISSPHNYSPTLPPLGVKIAPHSLLAHPHPHAWLDFVQTSRRPWVCQQDFSKATDEMLHKVSNGAANDILHLSGMSKPLRQNLC